MKPILYSSGDAAADRRADYAEMLFASGDRAAASELMAETMNLAPGWATGWFRLGEMHEATGEIAAAADAWREALRLDPADRLGSALKLELVGAIENAGGISSAFAETLFDQYAGKFEVELVQKLGYRVPELIAEALCATGRSSFAHALDLGCGTGLMGERLRAMASFLEGGDLSENMLKKARAKSVYDRLARQDLLTFEPERNSADLVTAADVFLYVGRLERVFAQVAAALVPGGLFAFSVERHDGAGDLHLGESRRYAHAPDYLRRLLSDTGFDLVAMDDAIIRRDRGTDVAGLIVVAERKTQSVWLDATLDDVPALDAHPH
ncbi:methyltransferase domain-containing protein [Mesorhizobium sp. YIM 152430]|uniref:class I SAM-dependent DNA methyltransferase n=1 Tax=Mesorhizobium sp. YIM 152430 TaxID=3031761 RepID=UPI0023DAB8DB|nr:methyltransferase domain-containing protein [Mesorhizobium sp. YIM 152430]MDF1599097.1 methyltransferase domain-containing protein [Mesorhizobium sp. YIM 152430]